MLENLEYVESRCSGFRRNPKSVEPEWRAYFEKSGNGSRPAGSSEPSVAEPSRAHGSVDESNSEIQVRLHEMIDNFRRHGHRIAAIDPLGTERLCPAELKPEFYNFSPRELDLLVNLPGLHFQAPLTMRELFDQLRKTYCSSSRAVRPPRQRHHRKPRPRIDRRLRMYLKRSMPPRSEI